MRDPMSAMPVLSTGHFGWDEMKVSVPDAGFRHRRFSEPPHVADMTFDYRDFKAIIMVEVHMKRRAHKIVVFVLRFGQALRQLSLMVVEHIREATYDVGARLRRQAVGVEALAQEVADGL